MNYLQKENTNYLLNTIRQYDIDTYEHCIRVSKLVKDSCLPTELDIELLCQASLLHDIGKIFIPKIILNKPGSLTKKEREIIDTHSLKGFYYLIQHEIFLKTCFIVLFHHGKEKVPKELWCYYHDLEQEIQCLQKFDKLDALTNDRPYRKAMSYHDAMSFINT